MTVEGMVFVVDDDDEFRASLVALLEAHGHCVVQYASGNAFLDAYDASQLGCVVLDVRLPDLNGLEVQARLAKGIAKPPIVMITGHGDIPMAVKALKAGALDFIEKPFDEDQFLRAVHRGLEQIEIAQHQAIRPAEAAERLGELSPRERQVLEQLLAGQSNKVIARELGISPRTVEVHRARLMNKAGAKSLSELIRLALAADFGSPGA